MSETLLTRRNFLQGLAATAVLIAMPKPVFAALSAPVRTLSFDNLHTGEKLAVTYWEQGAYVPGALAEINTILRDFRTGDVAEIDPALLDQLHVLHHTLGAKAPFEVISGYRSPNTNSMLRGEGHGVAKKSMHMEGKAIDIRLKDTKLTDIRDAALAMQAGGVGYYAANDFVHVDTGRIRKW